MSELTVGRIQELTTENNKLREANRRLQAEGPALERDKLVAGLREQVRELSSQLAIAESNAKVLAKRLIDTGEDAERLEAERDKLRAALEGLEWDDIDDLLTRDIEDCRRVGQTVADIQQNHIEAAGQSRLRAEKAEAQLKATAERAMKAECLVLWGCTACGELKGAADSAWRFNGDSYEHQCGDPQAGYFAGRIIEPGVVKGEFAKRERLEDRVAHWQEEYRDAISRYQQMIEERDGLQETINALHDRYGLHEEEKWALLPEGVDLADYLIQVNEALNTIAEWRFDIRGDCVADARKLATTALTAALHAEKGETNG